MGLARRRDWHPVCRFLLARPVIAQEIHRHVEQVDEAPDKPPRLTLAPAGVGEHEEIREERMGLRGGQVERLMHCLDFRRYDLLFGNGRRCNESIVVAVHLLPIAPRTRMRLTSRN